MLSRAFYFPRPTVSQKRKKGERNLIHVLGGGEDGREEGKGETEKKGLEKGIEGERGPPDEYTGIVFVLQMRKSDLGKFIRLV